MVHCGIARMSHTRTASLRMVSYFAPDEPEERFERCGALQFQRILRCRPVTFPGLVYKSFA